jgi:predicted Zn-ribbon and HTH transcriptional regulator
MTEEAQRMIEAWARRYGIPQCAECGEIYAPNQVDPAWPRCPRCGSSLYTSPERES